MRVVIDTDPGVDDALALAVAAHSPEIELVAITTTHGNVNIELAHRNAVYLMERLGRAEVPVYRGAEAPLARPRQGAEEVHGEHGLGYAQAAPPAAARSEHAVWALIEQARTAPYILMPIGPLTNVALALAIAPDVMRAGVERIVLMGGNVQAAGNVTPVSEFNFWADPEAARVVFASGIPIEMVGLDVTRKVIFSSSDVEALGGSGHEHGWVGEIKKMLRFYVDFHRKMERLDGCVINDPLAVALLLHPEWGRADELPVQIDCSWGPTQGQCVADRRPVTDQPPNCRAYLDVDPGAAGAWIAQRIVG